MGRITFQLIALLVASTVLTSCNMPAGAIPADGTLSIVEPLDGARYQTGEWITVRSELSVAGGAVEVKLLVNGQPVRTDGLRIALQNGSMLQLWQPSEEGTYTLQTRLTTASGAILESQSVVIEVGAAGTESVTPAPTNPAQTPTPTATAGPPVAIADQNAFCRLGPSQAYVATGEMLAGASSPISGRNAESTWWVVAAAYGGGTCWISDSVVTTSGDLSGVPVVNAPPLPPAAPVLIGPSGSQACSSSVDLTWHAVDHPNGIAHYEWEAQGPGGTDSGTAVDTAVEYVVACGGASYQWRVRAVANDGTTGPYSEFMGFTVQ